MSLAVLGAEPAFAEPLHVGRPNLPDRRLLHERLDAVLDRRWLTNDGPEVRAFEAELAARTRAAECVAVSNGTQALAVLARAMGLTGEVIVPSFTFIATAHAFAWQGLTPVFVDVDPATHNIDPDAACAAIGPRTSAIVGVHLWGRPCAVDRLRAIADQYGIALVFDAAHGLDCTLDGRQVGTFGDAEVFSFHATKVANAFEGGAITTGDAGLARRLRSLRNFGFAGYDEVTELGTNAKLTEIAAAMGRCSLADLDRCVDVNRAHHARYAAGLAGTPGIELVRFDRSERHNHHYVVCEVDAGTCGLTRDQLVAVLWAERVLARRYFAPGCHRMEPYRSQAPWAGTELPATEALAERVLVLPTGTAVTSDEIDTVCRLIATAVERAAEVRVAVATAR